MELAVGIAVARQPPHGSVRALVSAYGSSRGCRGAALPHTHDSWGVFFPHCVGRVWGGGTFSLISGFPSPFSADVLLSLFKWFMGTMPRSDSSQTYRRAVRPKPSPASPDGRDIGEVSRFSCRKYLGALGGLCLRRTVREAALALLEHVAFRLVQERRRPDCMFSGGQYPAHLFPSSTLDGMPRDLPRKTRNGIRLQRLKDKLGGRCLASSEVEYDRLPARILGEEGRGTAFVVEQLTGRGWTRSRPSPA